MSEAVNGKPALSRSTKVVVATSVMLSFISFWRAAAIVLADLGSSAFYAGGIAEQAIGQAAPWMILGVVLFFYAIRAVYVESCAMFTRGGVYRVVKEALGGTMAKFSVSALLFDYILTGPISGVSAGQYIIGLVAQTLTHFGHPWSPDKGTINQWAALIAIGVTIFFWWRNTKGIHESSGDAVRIMVITSVMAIILLGWSGLTFMAKPETRRLPPLPKAEQISFNQDAVGWMPGILPSALQQDAPAGAAASDHSASSEGAVQSGRYRLVARTASLMGLLGILIAFGHSILAISGAETLAQVNRELEHPKLKNLMRAGRVVFLYALIFTGSTPFLAYAFIPDAERARYADNLISGIAMHLVGPDLLKLVFQTFIVVVGFLMLSGAVNTSIIGSNAVLNRVSEDGVLTVWFRRPHKRYGTTYRIINIITSMQIITILLSRGEVYLLGEAYAFGVIWSFSFNALSMLVLRFKDKSPREWKVPGNLRLFGVEIPFGLGAIALMLFTLAIVNLLTKQVATVSGLVMTAAFSITQRERSATKHGLELFNLEPQESVAPETVAVRPGNVLCPVRDYHNLEHLRRGLDKTDTDKQDFVVMTVYLLRGPDTGYRELREDKLFSEYEQHLFSRVVTLAERAGKHVDLLVVPSPIPFEAIVQAAAQLVSAEIVMGRSAVMTARQQALRLGEAWERLPHKPRHRIRLTVYDNDGQEHVFHLGAHPPRLTAEDIGLIHTLWIDLKDDLHTADLRHRDVVTLALRRLERDCKEQARKDILQEARDLTATDRGPSRAIED
ncbi:MAG: APC family permease [Vicinamibacteria bacterium]|nr:APC family permease [Vicinamibacteria bacterium]